MNEIILSPDAKTNPAETPGAPDVSVTGPVAGGEKKTHDSGCCTPAATPVTAAGAKKHADSCVSHPPSGAPAVSAPAVSGGSCGADEKSGKPAGTCAN